MFILVYQLSGQIKMFSVFYIFKLITNNLTLINSNILITQNK